MSPYRPLDRNRRQTRYVTCPVCQGACEVTEVLGQDRVTGLIHDRVWPCRACNETGTVPAWHLEQPNWCGVCGLLNDCTSCDE